MNKQRITLAKAAEAEIEEKKSVFIGYAVPVKNEDEARQVISDRKKEYSDATHNVWAYYLNDGIVARYSDDGEPQGTAGVPVLNVLKQSSAQDLCVVVTRYFGGTLLGAGGLVRAYSASAKKAIDAAGFCTMEEFSVISITCCYSDYQKLTVMLRNMNVSEDKADFDSEVTITAALEVFRYDEVCQSINELCSGRCKIDKLYCEERQSRIQAL